MSWCRWGSHCACTFDSSISKNDCPNCPGSDLYIYESSEGIVCMDCLIVRAGRPAEVDPENYTAKTRMEMLQHIQQHVDAGHHVKLGLRRQCDEWLSEVPR